MESIQNQLRNLLLTKLSKLALGHENSLNPCLDIGRGVELEKDKGKTDDKDYPDNGHWPRANCMLDCNM